MSQGGGGRKGLFLFPTFYLGRSKGLCSKGRLQAVDRENETSPFPPKEFFEKDQRPDTGEWRTLNLCWTSIKLIVNVNTFYPSNANVFRGIPPPPRVLRTIIAVNCIALKQSNKFLHNIQLQQLSRTYNLWGSWPWIVRTHLELQPRFEAKQEKRENKKLFKGAKLLNSDLFLGFAAIMKQPRMNVAVA